MTPPSYLKGLRPSQLAVLRDYQGGRMGISAVPGSGKTFTLSMLAADLLLSGELGLDQEILIVTLSNSAVENFSQRIGGILKDHNLLPGMGYRVRTLHGLAHDIVRERPGLVGLANDFSIIDESEAIAIREGAAETWLRTHPYVFDDYIDPGLDEYSANKARATQLPRLAQGIALALIRCAKDAELTPEGLAKVLKAAPTPLPLAQMGLEIYQEYQRSLNYRGAVDFDDLIRLALGALRADPALLRRLRRQWPLILEDEAQDSSRLQQEILGMLAGSDGGWVRVGDPNQAIYETFTTANPQYLIDFLSAPGVMRRELPVSGRSSRTIIEVANRLVDWTQNAHPEPGARRALRPPFILPTEPGDPQENPPDDPRGVYFSSQKLTADQEMDLVIKSLLAWNEKQQALPEDQRETLAVLDLLNQRGAKLADDLRKNGIEPVEMLGVSTPTRLSAGALTHVLHSLSNPSSGALLAKALKVWIKRRETGLPDSAAKKAASAVGALRQVEDYLYPLPERDWLVNSGLAQSEPAVYDVLERFRPNVRRWHDAALLPIDQVILTLAQDLFTAPADLAIAHKLASALRSIADNHPTWRLPELSKELETIALNKRRFLGFSDDETGFDPDKYKGRIVLTTMHKAKGLEWDRVYLLSVNNYDFPSGSSYDQYRGESWFIRGRLNLEAEALAQLQAALSKDEYAWYEEGEATRKARVDLVCERLRLLFVGITRAKKYLAATWNTGKKGDQLPALPFLELQDYWQRELS